MATLGRTVSPEEYAAFIGQIELAAIWLQAARLVNHRGPDVPAEPAVEVAAEAQLSPSPAGFRCYHTYRVRLLAAADLAAELEAPFGVDFRAPAPQCRAVRSVPDLQPAGQYLALPARPARRSAGANELAAPHAASAQARGPVGRRREPCARGLTTARAAASGAGRVATCAGRRVA